MMVVDRNLKEQVKVIFNVNFKTLSSLIKNAFVGVWTLWILNARYDDTDFVLITRIWKKLMILTHKDIGKKLLRWIKQELCVTNQALNLCNKKSLNNSSSITLRYLNLQKYKCNVYQVYYFR